MDNGVGILLLVINNGLIIGWQYFSGNTNSWTSRTVTFSVTFKNVFCLVLGACCGRGDFSNTSVITYNIASRTWYSSFSKSTATIQNGSSIRAICIGN